MNIATMIITVIEDDDGQMTYDYGILSDDDDSRAKRECENLYQITLSMIDAYKEAMN